MKIVSAVRLDEGQRARLDEIVSGVEIKDGTATSNDEIAAMLDDDTEVLYTFPVPKDLMDRAPRLRWLQLLSAGCNRVVGNAVVDTDVKIATSSGIHATPIAEHVLTMMLAHYRLLPHAFRGQSRHEWLPQSDFSRHVRELRRRAVGIVGYGSIGREVARLSAVFGSKILAMKRNPNARADSGYNVPDTGDPEGVIPERFYGQDELIPFLGECDVVVLAMPLTASTRYMFGRKEFDAMKPGSLLVNIARGDVVVQDEMIEALKDGRLGGAALDVFDEEPLGADSPLWDMENVIITPHISGASRPYLRRAFEILCENLRRLVADEPLLNLMDRKEGY